MTDEAQDRELEDLRRELAEAKSLLVEQSERIDKLEKQASNAPPRDLDPLQMTIPRYASIPSIPVLDGIDKETKAQSSTLEQMRADAHRWHMHQRKAQRLARKRDQNFKRLVAVLAVVSIPIAGVLTELLRLLHH
jgi:hypothetical protein